MRFDANYECIITVYLVAQECRSAPNMPLYFVTPPDMPASNAFRFSPGLGQVFPEKMCKLDFSPYKVADLTTVTHDRYPIVIGVESIYPTNYKGKARKSM